MSTTPTTSENRARIPYTVIGGPRWDRVRRYPYPLTLLVLGRGDRLFKGELLKDLEGRALGEILWVETPELSSDVQTLSHDFPDVRFLLVKTPCSAGERINIGMVEARAPLVLVLWSDTRLVSLSPMMLGAVEKSGILRTTPLARNAQREPIPSWQSPLWKRRRLSIVFRVPRRSGERTLFPFDYCGLYNREKFGQSGGFDHAIANPYWQKLDFGFRCFLWGEQLQGSTELVLGYTGSPPEENTTPDQGYKIFWMKNLAMRVHREMGVLPAWRVLDYIAHSDTGPLSAITEFRTVRAWVRTHRFRFRRDARDVVERWENA